MLVSQRHRHLQRPSSHDDALLAEACAKLGPALPGHRPPRHGDILEGRAWEPDLALAVQDSDVICPCGQHGLSFVHLSLKTMT